MATNWSSTTGTTVPAGRAYGADRGATALDPADDVRAFVEVALADFIDAQVSSLAELDPALEALAAVTRDAVLAGGKRIRPTFAYWGWRGVVGREAPVAPAVPALAALELLHAFALVHDDVMDDSPTRRGRPTAHRTLATTHQTRRLRGDAKRFGRSGAILVGDLCLVWADQMIALSGLADATVTAARRAYDRMRVDAIAGQFLDVLGESSRSWTIERALLTARLKTASYTVTQPLLYGAALAPAAEPAVTEAYHRYGTAIGEAFQLRDDLLDLYGDPTALGKPVGEDLASGRPTVLLQLARSKATVGQAAEMVRLVGRRGGDVMPRLVEVIEETGAVAEVNYMINHRVTHALATLHTAPIDPPARQALTDLAVTAAFRAE